MVRWPREGRSSGRGYTTIWGKTKCVWLGGWGRFCLYHSRFLSRQHGFDYALLCVADKLAVSLEPWWLYLPRAILSGEIGEYMKHGEAGAKGKGKYAGEPHTAKTPYQNRKDWFVRMSGYMRRWAYEHRDGKPDTWTPETRTAIDATGTWQ